MTHDISRGWDNRTYDWDDLLDLTGMAALHYVGGSVAPACLRDSSSNFLMIGMPLPKGNPPGTENLKARANLNDAEDALFSYLKHLQDMVYRDQITPDRAVREQENRIEQYAQEHGIELSEDRMADLWLEIESVHISGREWAEKGRIAK